jgi:nucleotide-binding universal stress UspA family protein
MINIQRIVCPMDLSSESDEALRYAVALARAYDANLLLLHCTEIKSRNRESESRPLSVDMACAFEQALINHLGLAELCNLKWKALAIDNVQDIGQAIAHHAAKHKADLIVMRSRRRPHAAVLLGSTAETVSRTAPCPVLVTHPGEREWIGLSTGEIDLHRILVAHDFSADSELALNYGISLAQEYQAEVHLLHVIRNGEQEEPEVAWSHVGVESLYPSAARRLQQAVRKEALLWCNLVTAVRCGQPYEEVIAYADEHEIDLICIGASGSDFSVEALFGSNADRVLRQAHCPVLVARPIKPAEQCACDAVETSVRK